MERLKSSRHRRFRILRIFRWKPRAKTGLDKSWDEWLGERLARMRRRCKAPFRAVMKALKPAKTGLDTYWVDPFARLRGWCLLTFVAAINVFVGALSLADYLGALYRWPWTFIE